MTSRPVLFVLSFVLTVAPAAARAQGPVSVDASVGVRRGWGGDEQRRRAGQTLDVVAAARLGRAARGGPVVGLAAGVEGPSGGVTDCLVGAQGGCIPYFPAYFSAGALGGWEQRVGGVVVRGLAGPTYFRNLDVARQTVGASARLDVAAPIASRLAVMAFTRGALLRAPGRAADLENLLTVGSVGIGLRVR